MSEPADASSGSTTDSLWAKSPIEGQVEGQTLTEHTEQALSVLASLRVRHEGLAGQVGDERIWSWAAAALLIHDLGKAARPFQEVLRGQRGRWGHRHEVLSLAFVPLVARPGSRDFTWIAAGVASHHRDARPLLRERYDPRAPREDLDLESLMTGLDARTVDGIVRWVKTRLSVWPYLVFAAAEAAAAVPNEGTAFISNKGTAFVPDEETVVEGLEAYDRVAAMGDPAALRLALALRGLVVQSDHAASGGCRHLETADIPSPAKLARLLSRNAPGGKWCWTQYQREVGRREGSLVFTAPTGSGKTEAALLWAHRQQSSRGSGSRIIYVLPYQASLNAMRTRLRRLLRVEVGLLHGKALQALYREAQAESDSGPEAESTAKRMAELGRLNQPGLTTSTFYQLLRAAYRLPGYETLWTSLSDTLIIVDEVHAYEPQRLGLFLGLLSEACRTWGARVCAMSATMPGWLRQRLRQEIQAAEVTADTATFKRFIRHRVAIRPGSVDDGGVIDEICGVATRSRAVLVAVNTVSAAQATAVRLRQRLGDGSVILLHSRFSARDRLAKEERVTSAVSLDTPGVGALAPLVVVATQVIEVSLNLSFNTIYTEPAPIEALMQRFGRVNRRGSMGVVPVNVLTAPDDGQGIYDPRLVRGALRVLSAHDGREIDEGEVSVWLDHVYQGLAEEYGAEVESAASRFRTECLAGLRPFDADPALEDAFDNLFDGFEVLPASSLTAYLESRETSVLEAGSLLVPVTRRFVSAAYRQGRCVWDDSLRLRIVDLPYSPETGLEIETVS